MNESLGIIEAAGWQLEPTPWARHAACAGVDPELFFPGKGGSARAARAVCVTCPVQHECLDYALRWNIKHGIWGGVSQWDRRRLRRQQRPMRVPAPRFL